MMNFISKDRLLRLRKLHGRLYENKMAHQKRIEDKSLLKKGLRDSKKQKDTIRRCFFPVDIVIPWVDGNDPHWLAEKAFYQPKNKSIEKNNPDARYREWGTFRYWFRAVEKYAPWVNNIYFITWGHVPSWLDASHPKLKIVKHTDFIPQEYLPTFHVNPIELNLWRIEGLSEHFVYFNDDVFLTRLTAKEDFFYGELPKYCGLSKPNRPHANMTAYEHMLLNNVGLFNSEYDIRKCIEKNPEKWFSAKYKSDWDRNYTAYKDGYSSGFFANHLALPLRKSTMKKVATLFQKQIEETCSGKFRDYNNINDQVFELMEIYEGTFEPVEPDYFGNVFNIARWSIEAIKEEILNEKHIMLCANDWEGIKEEEYDELKEELLDSFSMKFPTRSEFEIME